MAQKRTFMQKVVAFLDSSNVKGTDPQYIALPERPWRVVLGGNTDQLDLTMTSYVQRTSADVRTPIAFDFSMKVKPPVGNSVGLWAGYRGWGLGYSFSVTGNKGINLSFNISTPANGVNVRVHRFEFGNPNFAIQNLQVDGKKYADISSNGEALEEPVNIESMVLDGYWVFNSKRFSLAAPYGQSTLQLRSAGSFLAGLMIYYQKFDFSQKRNFMVSAFSNNVGTLKLYQGSIGVGYTYNWVPARNWTFNFVLMPVVSLLNRVRLSNYTLKINEERYDQNDPWANIELVHTGNTSHNGRINLNLDARVAASYWWKRFSFGIIGQGHQFDSKYDDTRVKMTDWEIKASIGYNI